MRKTLALMILFTLCGGNSFAAPKTLNCTSGASYEFFSATLDDSHFDPGSGYFDVIEPKFVDNYLTLPRMTCVGNQLGSIDCVGFAFGSKGYIEEVTLIKRGERFFATLVNLKGPEIEMHNGPWPCTVR